jgi:hypothetical protein
MAGPRCVLRCSGDISLLIQLNRQGDARPVTPPSTSQELSYEEATPSRANTPLPRANTPPRSQRDIEISAPGAVTVDTPIRRSKRALQRFRDALGDMCRPVANLFSPSRRSSASGVIRVDPSTVLPALPVLPSLTPPLAASSALFELPTSLPLDLVSAPSACPASVTAALPRTSVAIPAVSLPRLSLDARMKAARGAHLTTRATASPISASTPPAPLYQSAPSVDDAQRAHRDIVNILEPRRANGKGHDPFEGDETLRKRLVLVRQHLWLYTHPDEHQRLGWKAASKQAASNLERGTKAGAEQIRIWARRFLNDREDLPFNLYGAYNVSMLERGDLAQAIHLHLQSLGSYVCAMDIVCFLDDPKVQANHGLKKSISLATAKRWLEAMDYRWSKTPKGTL